LAVLSGFAGLSYEMIWTQQLSLGLGHEFVAVLAVLAAFFGGLAIGALSLGRAIERSSRPARWYAACEALLAGWALVQSAAMPYATRVLAAWIGPRPSTLWHWSVAFVGPLVLLAPATIAMGAALPALERTLLAAPRALRASTGASLPQPSWIGALYAANTFGAVLGVLGCSFVLVPQFGLSGSLRSCAALNALCAMAALAGWYRQRAPAQQPELPRSATHGFQLLACLAATGALGIGYEVAVVRVLSQISEDTVYTFALLLALYLLGTAAGGALHQRSFARRAALRSVREPLCIAAAAACLLGAITLWYAGPVKSLATDCLSDSLGALAAALAGEALVGVAAFGLPTVAMGMLFNQLCVEAEHSHVGFGLALASNTLGAALAPALVGVWLLPSWGPKPLLLGIALGYLALLGPRSLGRLRVALPALASAACIGLGFGYLPALVVVDVPASGKLVRYAEGVAAAVSVVEDASGVATLRINNRQQEGSNATLLTDARLAWLPLLLHPRPRRALFLGYGTGLTAGAAAWDPELRVDAVELLPEVVTMAEYFAPVLQSSRRPDIVVSDARRFIRAPGRQYEVIVADLFHPARSGSGALYSVEHFAAVRGRLAPAGLFCQWLPLHQLDVTSLRSIVRSFLTVYPDALAVLATHSLDTPVLGLVARRDHPGFELAAVQQRIALLAEPARLARLHLEDEYAVLGSFIASSQALTRFAGTAPQNTDDRPVVTHRAPLATYAPRSSPRQRLLQLVHAFEIQSADVLPGAASPNARLTAYFRARDRFIEVGTQVRPSGVAAVMLEQIGAPLIDILHQSPEFRPAYDPLLRIAQALLPQDASEAGRLLTQLIAAQPERPEAGQLLARLPDRAQPASTQ
jgi:spermidine synthase